MGLFDKLNPFDKPQQEEPQRPVLDQAKDGASDDMVSRLVESLLSMGIDGKGPMKSAAEYADKARDKEKSTVKAIDKVVDDHVRVATVGGFATGLGGFLTMPVALPANIVEFYVTATRMVAGIAHLRGYDLKAPEVRTAVLLTLTGTKNDDLLAKVGVNPVTGRATAVALQRLPQSALMMVNKGIGFRLLTNVSEKMLAKLGKFIPLAGGVIGGGLDHMLMRRIAKNAQREFPEVIKGSTL